jgi:exo-beta-1,3-glucanase (GH17 family)
MIAERWSLVRVYGSVGPADSILAVIREDRLPLRVMLGVWIAPDEARDSTGAVIERFPEAAEANRAELEAAVRLTAAYPEIVAALCVGNETQVFWSSHRVPTPLLAADVRELRARTKAPVTTGDDYLYWKTPESAALAADLDFLVAHFHPLWAGRTLEGAVAWTRAAYEEVQAAHPTRTVVIGETGWATRRLHTGEQGTLMKGAVGEPEQASYCTGIAAWANAARVPLFLFEAFDENWKGGPEPDDAEKHWGLYRADRTPKQVLSGGE